MLPGEAPGGVICAASGAPVGAGFALVVVLMEFCPLYTGEAPVPPAGAMLPGDICGDGEDIAAFGAPVGAGDVIEVCARAMPPDRQNAAEANKVKRMEIS